MAAAMVAAVAAVAVTFLGSSAGRIAGASAPSAPPARVCADPTLLDGPPTPPAGAVSLPAGTDTALLGANWKITADTTYWFAPGTHTIGTGQYDQIEAANGDTFVGAPGAVLNGQGKNDFAFTGKATDVTVEYLTVTDFAAPATQGVVNHTAATGWTVTHDTVETSTAGAGVEIGSTQQVTYDCLTHNRQYGFNAYSTTGAVRNVTMSHDEISLNDGTGTSHLPTTCGCSGGGKFWNTLDATISTSYVHTNGNVGLWVDTDNAGFDISHNYIAHNYGEGVMYEVSYNATISSNTFVANGIGAGLGNPGFPTGAVYVSESGGDSRVASDYAGTFEVSGNVFTDNYGGVVVWENSNRYCGDGSDDMCTLVTPATYTVSSCSAHVHSSKPTQTPDYYDDCRWKAQNVTVEDNTFNFTPSAVSSGCTEANSCGFNGLFSEYGTTAPWTAWTVPLHISDDQHDVFTDNTYTGPWHFEGFNQGDQVTWTQWTKGFTDWNGSGDHFDAQDAGSTFNGTPSPVTSPTSPTQPGPTTPTTDPPSTTSTDPPTTTTTSASPHTHYVCGGSAKAGASSVKLTCKETGSLPTGTQVYSCSGTSTTGTSNLPLTCKEEK